MGFVLTSNVCKLLESTTFLYIQIVVFKERGYEDQIEEGAEEEQCQRSDSLNLTVAKGQRTLI